ncbi:unnamed protein product [Bursaphelenchus xylophilus]|uniref:(pine wood nematode) hypothetical protein n=1 Tax=Bursaphelenchus xylophilus TaxID=6326 RepID=A0A1I7SCW2_BURXY|nr:unnamed protein product [Bursaphelenchus xylophilus]CAG9093374.1 unnamed protein product [Bursaphelenchus xylophilus]
MNVYLICGILFGAFCAVEPDQLIDKLYLIVKDAGLNYSLDQVAEYSTMFHRLMNDINNRAHLDLDNQIIEFIDDILILPNYNLRGVEFNEAVRVYRNDMFPWMRGNASLGWEESALGFEATLLDLLRNSTHRIIDANCQQFLGITQHQLTEQICEIYAKYIQHDIKDDPFRVTDPLLEALYGNNSNAAVLLYQDLLQMRVTPTTDNAQ